MFVQNVSFLVFVGSRNTLLMMGRDFNEADLFI